MRYTSAILYIHAQLLQNWEPFVSQGLIVPDLVFPSPGKVPNSHIELYRKLDICLLPRVYLYLRGKARQLGARSAPRMQQGCPARA